jgi:hypothetical protein
MEAGYTLFSLEEEEGVVSNADRLAALVRSAAGSPHSAGTQQKTMARQATPCDLVSSGEAREVSLQALTDTAISIAGELQARLASGGDDERDAQAATSGEATLLDFHAIISRKDAVSSTTGESPCSPVEATAHFALGLLEETLLLYKRRYSASDVDASASKTDAGVKRRRLLTRFFRAFALS